MYNLNFLNWWAHIGLSVLRTIHFNTLRKLQKCNPLWFLLSRKRQIKKLQGYIIACFNLKKESTKNFQFNENKNVSIHCDIYDKKARLISFDMKTMKASISAGNHCIHQAIHCIFSNLQDYVFFSATSDTFKYTIKYLRKHNI